MDDGPAKKKSKKKKGMTTESEDHKSKSQTRERRLDGGLIVSDILLGTGPQVKPGKRISLHYTGSLRSTGKVFDKNSSKQYPLVFRQGTGEVIRGKCSYHTLFTT
jgi:FKBP-type peptidyl-prolyl cis-trans isomerase